MLDALNPRFAEAQQIAPEDARIAAGLYAKFLRRKDMAKSGAFWSGRQNRNRQLPAILVVHENRGLNPHIEDIARRLAVDGFIAFAPDALYPLGGYPGDEDKARELFPKLDQAKTRTISSRRPTA